jgi:hypothetical protein
VLHWQFRAITELHKKCQHTPNSWCFAGALARPPVQSNPTPHGSTGKENQHPLSSTTPSYFLDMFLYLSFSSVIGKEAGRQWKIVQEDVGCAGAIASFIALWCCNRGGKAAGWGTCHSTCHSLRPSCLHNMRPHSRVAILHKPEVTRSRVTESCDAISRGDQPNQAHIGGVCKVALLHAFTDQRNWQPLWTPWPWSCRLNRARI